MRLKPARLGRVAALVGVTVALAGASLLGATAAEAANLGTGPGLTFSPTSGATSMTGNQVTYNAPACPSAAQGSAVLRAVNTDGTTYNVSGVNNSVAAAFTGTLLNGITLAAIEANGNVGNGGVQEIVVLCFPGASAAGTAVNTVDDFITWSADGLSWTSGQPTPATATTTTLAASPSPATTNATITLTATVTAASGTAAPAGTVTFSVVGGSTIASGVALTAGSGASATATTTTSFPTGGTYQIQAAFTPTSPTTFAASTSSAFSENVLGALSEPLQVTVASAGTFNITIATGTVTLTPNAAQSSAAGTTQPVTVLDSRNTFPGWSVSAQDINFTENTSVKAGSIAGCNLGWTPTGTLTDATLGATVAPSCTAATGGLASAQVWASAHAGHGGTAAAGDQISANLNLNIPTGTPAATYSSALSLSYTTANA